MYVCGGGDALCQSADIMDTCLPYNFVGHWPESVEVTSVKEKKKRRLRLEHLYTWCVVHRSVWFVFAACVFFSRERQSSSASEMTFFLDCTGPDHSHKVSIHLFHSFCKMRGKK